MAIPWTKISVLLVSFSILACLPGAGQTITVTIKGAVGTLASPQNGQPPPLDSSVQVGTPYTFVQTIDANAPLDLGGYVSGPTYVSSLTVGDYDFVTNGSTTYVGSGGLNLFPNQNYQTYQGVEDPLVQARLEYEPGDPNQTLSTLPLDTIADFEGGDVELSELPGGSEFLFAGNVTSFQAIETPEPSIFALLTCSVFFALGYRRWVSKRSIGFT